MYHDVALIEFPEYTRPVAVNMMPFLFGDPDSLPPELWGYRPILDQCRGIEKGRVAYLTITAGEVTAGKSQRRGGIHTESTKILAWGGGWGGGSYPTPVPPPKETPKPPQKPKKEAPAKEKRRGTESLGIYMASTDGRCRVWDVDTRDVDDHGALITLPETPGEIMAPSTLYWMTDRTPHEALESLHTGTRQFIRVVSHQIGGWWAQHNTANPLGILPDAPVLTHSKFS